MTMLTVFESRKLNLIHLLETAGVSGKEFAKRVDMNPGYLSQILGPKGAKNLGETIARRIEEKLGIERGWMDHQQAQDAVDNAIKLWGVVLEQQMKIAHYLNTLSAKEKSHLEGLIKYMAEEKPTDGN